MKKIIFAVFAIVALLSACKKEVHDDFVPQNPDGPTPSQTWINISGGGYKVEFTNVLSGATLNFNGGGNYLAYLNPDTTVKAVWQIFDANMNLVYGPTPLVNQIIYTFASSQTYHLQAVNLPNVNITNVTLIFGNGGTQPSTTNYEVRYLNAEYNSATTNYEYIFRGHKGFINGVNYYFQVGEVWNNNYAPVTTGVSTYGPDSLDIRIPFTAISSPILRRFAYGANLSGNVNSWISLCTGTWHAGLTGPPNEDLWQFYPAYGVAVPFGGNTSTKPGLISDPSGNHPDIFPVTANVGFGTMTGYHFYPKIVGQNFLMPQFRYKAGAPGAVFDPMANWTYVAGTQLLSNPNYWQATYPLQPGGGELWVQYGTGGSWPFFLMQYSSRYDPVSSTLHISY